MLPLMNIAFGAGDKPPRYGKAVKWNIAIESASEADTVRASTKALVKPPQHEWLVGTDWQLAPKDAREAEPFMLRQGLQRSTQHERILAFSVRPEPVEGRRFTQSDVAL